MLNAESGGGPFLGKLVMTADLFHGQIAPNRAAPILNRCANRFRRPIYSLRVLRCTGMTNFSAWIHQGSVSYLRGTEATEKLLLHATLHELVVGYWIQLPIGCFAARIESSVLANCAKQEVGAT